MWTCRCGNHNRMSVKNCTVCGAWMPQSERDRIYNEQLSGVRARSLGRKLTALANGFQRILELFGVPKDSALKIRTGTAKIIRGYWWILAIVIIVRIWIFGIKGFIELINSVFW